jgi:hypothetical protein
MNMKRGRMSAVPSMAVAPEPPLDTGSFVPKPDIQAQQSGGGPCRALPIKFAYGYANRNARHQSRD